MNTINNKFSIIICNYNGEKYLESCIQSCLNQQFWNKEIIVVDGKSTDSSHAIIKKFWNNIVWVTEKDTGISDAFNRGVWVASGNWIMYLGSDDYFYNPDILKNVDFYIKTIYEHCKADIHKMNFYAASINQYEDGKSNLVDNNYEIHTKNLIKYWTPVWLQNIYFNRNWIFNNLLDIQNKYSMDYDIYFRMVCSWQIFTKLHGIINSINLQWENISTKLARKQAAEALKVARKYARGMEENTAIFARHLKYIYHSFFTWH